MSNPAPALAEIDAAIAKGEWWVALFDALSDVGMERVRALKPAKGGRFAGVVEVYCRLALAVRLAIVAAMRLDVILQGLADLRRLAPEAIVAARAGARARAEEAAASKAKARDEARAKRKARASENEADPADGETQDSESPEPEAEVLRDRDPDVEALERSLDVDPANVDFDALPLHETVERICAALGVTPNWSRWEAGDWTMGDLTPSAQVDVPRQDPARAPDPPSHCLAASPPKPSGSGKSVVTQAAIPVSPTLPTLPGLTPRRSDTAISLALAAHAGPNAPPWAPRRRE